MRSESAFRANINRQPRATLNILKPASILDTSKNQQHGPLRRVLPATRQATTLDELRPGARVNLELDLVNRLVARCARTARADLPRMALALPGAGYVSGQKRPAERLLSAFTNPSDQRW